MMLHSMKCLIYPLVNTEFTFGENQISSLGKFEFTFFTHIFQGQQY
jgi:hypothetical protein